MAGYRVTSRFWDAPRGEYVDPGAAWTPADAEQAAYLQRAGCIVPAAAGPDRRPAAPASGPEAAKYRALAEARSVKELREILDDNEVEVPAAAKKADLVELVVADALEHAAEDASATGAPPAGG